MRTLSIDQYILGQHGDLLILNKPYDWPTTGRSLEDDDCVQFHLMKRFESMVWSIHQLDADTSGLCLFSLSKELVTHIQGVWSDAETIKEYYAVVWGEPTWDYIEELSPIGMIDERSLGVSRSGKAAHTKFEVIQRNSGFSLIRARILTGRTHQIRIHLSHLGYPLVGEEWYSKEPCTLHRRQALHASRIEFPASVDVDPNLLYAPIPPDLVVLAKKLGLSFPDQRTST